MIAGHIKTDVVLISKIYVSWCPPSALAKKKFGNVVRILPKIMQCIVDSSGDN